MFKVNGRPILYWIIKTFSSFDLAPTIVINPKDKHEIINCLDKYNLKYELVMQFSPLGMGDAVLCFETSRMYHDVDHILLVWGDIPFIQDKTLNVLVKQHLYKENDLTFVTKQSRFPYTVIERDEKGDVIGLLETRELKIAPPLVGERDIGLFIFKKELIMGMLSKNLAGKYGGETQEHGFLYLISHLVKAGAKVEALEIATDLDLISLNTTSDIETLSNFVVNQKV